MLIDLLDALHQFLADSLMVLHLLLGTHFLLNFDYDMRMQKEILEATLLNALHQRMGYQLLGRLFPFILREYLAHHL